MVLYEKQVRACGFFAKSTVLKIYSYKIAYIYTQRGRKYRAISLKLKGQKCVRVKLYYHDSGKKR